MRDEQFEVDGARMVKVDQRALVERQVIGLSVIMVLRDDAHFLKRDLVHDLAHYGGFSAACASGYTNYEHRWDFVGAKIRENSESAIAGA